MQTLGELEAMYCSAKPEELSKIIDGSSVDVTSMEGMTFMNPGDLNKRNKYFDQSGKGSIFNMSNGGNDTP